MVEDLAKKRSPKPQYDALYFIQSSMDSVNKIVEDFRAIPPYASVNIFVTGGKPKKFVGFFWWIPFKNLTHLYLELTDTMLNKLKQSPVGQYIQTLKELHIDYLGKNNYWRNY